MGLVNAAGFPSKSKPEPVKKTKKTKPVEKSEPTIEELVESLPEECCALGCNECFLDEAK
jgi:hypothetical protein